MIERTPILNAVTYLIMILGLILILGPFWMIFTASTQSLQEVTAVPFNMTPGGDFLKNVHSAWDRANLGPALLNSLFWPSAFLSNSLLLLIAL